MTRTLTLDAARARLDRHQVTLADLTRRYPSHRLARLRANLQSMSANLDDVQDFNEFLAAQIPQRLGALILAADDLAAKLDRKSARLDFARIKRLAATASDDDLPPIAAEQAAATVRLLAVS